MMQLLAFFSVYLLGGLGCVFFASIRCKRRNLLDLASMLLLWPLCAPFLFASMEPEQARSMAQCPPEVEMRVLAKHCQDLKVRVGEIDGLLGHDKWKRDLVTSRRADLDPTSPATRAALEALSVQLSHIERLHFLRKVHQAELEETQALLEQLRSQEQLSRFLGAPGAEGDLRLDAIRERIADSELMLASETELISLCHESL